MYLCLKKLQAEACIGAGTVYIVVSEFITECTIVLLYALDKTWQADITNCHYGAGSLA